MTRGQSGSASYGKMMNNNKKYGGDYRRHIHVTGQASAGATPDLATFTVGVNTEAETAAQAVERAVGQVLDQQLRTRDIYSDGMTLVSTAEMGDAVVQALKK